MEKINLGTNTGSNVVHCPFNEHHTMPKKTLILHLSKCPDRKSSLVTCAFNLQHVVPKKDLEAHEQQCTSRLDFDQMIYQTNTNQLQVTLRGPETNDDLDETWDDKNSSTIPVQNVIETIKQTPCYMKPPAGCTKSERKKYRSEAKNAYSNNDAAFKSYLSTNDKLHSATSNGGRNVNQSNQQIKNKGLFIGNRPNT